ncbi:MULTISPECIES: response regulator transcription factor [unclassified Streptomyces]|uniref:response regulator transcription factor n=1 Tax=unclassified Streptomyces TaxID=2593676 RepID=UPI0033FA4C0C
MPASASGGSCPRTWPDHARRLIAASSDGRSARDRAQRLVGSLTEREVEVLAGLGEGLSNAQIGARLYLSEATIKGYVSRLLDKLGCVSRTQAGPIVHDAGLVGSWVPSSDGSPMARPQRHRCRCGRPVCPPARRLHRSGRVRRTRRRSRR